MVSAFRTRVRAVHPDANAGAGDPERVALLVRARSTLAGPGREAYANALRAHRAKQAAIATPPKSVTKKPFDWDETCKKVKAQAKIDLARHEERERELERQARARAEASVEQEWADDSLKQGRPASGWCDPQVDADDFAGWAQARAKELLSRARVRAERNLAAVWARAEANLVAEQLRVEKAVVAGLERAERMPAATRAREREALFARGRAEVEKLRRQAREEIDHQIRLSRADIDAALNQSVQLLTPVRSRNAGSASQR